jgi:hypothetical protein
MKHADKLKYNKKQKMELIADMYSFIGEDLYLVLCMEEIAELIEVTSDCTNNKIDYIHMAEELVDVKISIACMLFIFNLKESDLSKVDKRKKKKNSVIIESIQNLSKAQQCISKFIRKSDNASDKVLLAINNMNDAMITLASIFKIKKKDMDKIEAIKYKRLEERVEKLKKATIE